MKQATELLQQVAPGVRRIVSTQAGPHHPVNGYVVDTPQGVVLIDPPADLTPNVLRDAGLAQPTAILVTHLQREHIEGAANFPDTPLHVPEGDAYLAAGEAAYLAIDTTWLEPWDWEGRGNYQGHMGGALNERPPREPLPLSTPLVPGQPTAGFDVISTPGHGKHAVTLAISLTNAAGEATRVAFTGDAIHAGGTLWNWFDMEWDYGCQFGHRALLTSLDAIDAVAADVLLPAHGEAIHEPAADIATLRSRLGAIFEPAIDTSQLDLPGPRQVINFPDVDSPAPGFREILPNLHQWKVLGNCAVLISESGHAMLVDDGLCYWHPLPERARHHRQVMTDMKQALGIERVELVIPTHYHGDHTENIDEIREMDGSEVVSLDIVADAIEYPERFNLACKLPWYGTANGTVKIDRRVESGTVFNWREFEIEIFHLGGQTYYHAGIRVVVDGQTVLFVGDAVAGQFIGQDPVLCYNDNEPSERGWSYSVDRMLEREPDLLVCGHAAAVKNPMPMLRAKRKVWDVQLERFDALNPRASRRLFFDPFVDG